MRRVLVLVGGLGLLAACSPGINISVPEVPTTGHETTTTSRPDYSIVNLAAVPGRTTTTVPPLGPGPAHLAGRVMGPGGPVGGAVVRVERIVGTTVALTDVQSQADGS